MNYSTLKALIAAAALSGAFTIGASAQAEDAATLVRRLGERDAVTRQVAAEELARLVAVEHMRVVEGYRMQERDARVRLALDWALYRMGKSQALFEVVRSLDSSRAEQALSYLAQLETPEPLYVFLTRSNAKTQVRLLEALARVGDAATLERIKPFTESLDPLISDAAKFAEREITIRLEEPHAADEVKRPRKVGQEPVEPVDPVDP